MSSHVILVLHLNIHAEGVVGPVAGWLDLTSVLLRGEEETEDSFYLLCAFSLFFLFFISCRLLCLIQGREENLPETPIFGKETSRA